MVGGMKGKLCSITNSIGPEVSGVVTSVILNKFCMEKKKKDFQ